MPKLIKTCDFKARIWLPKPRDQVFAFFANPRNLDRLTPPWLRFEILTQDPIEMRAGTRLDYKLRIHGVPIRWQSEITVWEPPLRFVDRQTRGPYRSWLHTHVFFSHQGGTVVVDFVRYAAPGGSVVQRLLVAPDLQRIFSYRHEILQKLFDAHIAVPAV
jgi:ligand-binding SRPBCC domain-containing protein